MAYKDIQLTPAGFKGTYHDSHGEYKFSAQFHLVLIQKAYHKGCSFEDLADGFGEGKGTMGGDWSGIRDSSPNATNKMLERALNFLFPD